MVKRTGGGTDTPLCSVCVANYNGINVIEACIGSILHQDCGFEIEILVHDDASTDASVQLLRNQYPMVRLLESDTNIGFCAANNRMADSARGAFLLFLNNDAELFPDALRALWSATKAAEKPGVLGLPQYSAATGELIDRGSYVDLFLNPVPNRDEAIEDVAMIIGACLWVPRQVWNDVGGFPSWLQMLAEDTYLCLAARLRGYPVRVLRQSGFRHWVGYSLGGGKVVENRLATSKIRRQMSERNKTLVMVVCLPAPWMQMVLPLHAALLLLEGVTLAFVKGDASVLTDIYVAAMRGVWKLRATLLDARRGVQASRVVSALEFFRCVRLTPHKIRLLLVHGVPEIR